MSGYSSPTASPSLRPRSRSNTLSPRLSSEKLLPSIPEDAGSEPAQSSPPPPYTNARLINNHLAAVVELVNQTSRAAPPVHHTRHVYQDIQYQYDPESHGVNAQEFHETARRRQHAQLAGLLLFGLFLVSCASVLVVFIATAVRAGRQSAHDFEMRKQCFLTHNQAPHCNGLYGRW